MNDRSLSVGLRVRNMQAFSRVSSTVDDRQNDVDYGFITYDDNGEYQVTSCRMGFRSDHIHDLFGGGERRASVQDPHDADRGIIIEDEGKGVILTRRNGDTVTQLDGEGRKAEDTDRAADAKSHAAEIERLRAEHQAEIDAIRAERKAAVTV